MPVRSRQATVCAALLLVVLLGLLFARPQPAIAGSETLEGLFTVVWGDPPPQSRVGVHHQIYLLTDDDGAMKKLAIDEGADIAVGLLRLNGERVRVETAPAVASGQDPAVVESIAPVDEGVQASSYPPPLTGELPWASILCRFGDSPDVTPRPASWFEGLFSDAWPGLEHFFAALSFGAITFGEAPVAGWYDLPGDKDDYLQPSGVPKFHALLYDCTSAAMDDLDLSAVRGVNLMFNESFGCCAWGGKAGMSWTGNPGVVAVTWMPPFGYNDRRVLAHEMGHGIGLPHSSGRYNATYDSRWDVMSFGGSCSPSFSEYGCVPVHTIGYHKRLLGWIDAADRTTIPTGAETTIALDRLGAPSDGSGYLYAEIPIDGSTTEFYTIEVREFVSYDEQVPHEAILIHHVDRDRTDRVAQVVDVDGKGNPNSAGAVLQAGQQWVDADNGILIRAEETTASGYMVTVSNGLAVDPVEEPTPVPTPTPDPEPTPTPTSEPPPLQESLLMPSAMRNSTSW